MSYCISHYHQLIIGLSDNSLVQLNTKESFQLCLVESRKYRRCGVELNDSLGETSTRFKFRSVLEINLPHDKILIIDPVFSRARLILQFHSVCSGTLR